METAKSADGTAIAYECAGDGPPLVVSVGAFCTRQTFVAPEDLRQRFTVVTYDRRGRGDSGDIQPFAAEREYEDLAAVAAAVGPQPPFAFGHSSGAAIALRAAAAGLPLAGIVAYEAPFTDEDTPRPAIDPADHIRELVSSGRRGEAVTFWMSEVVQLPAEVLAQMDGAPWVKDLEPLTPTLPYDLAVTAGGVPTAELAKDHRARPHPRRKEQPRMVPATPSRSKPRPRQVRGSRCSTATITTPRLRSSPLS